MRILWVSNAGFTRTGYGVATNAVVKQMMAAGHDVKVLAYYGLTNAGEVEIDGITYYSPRMDQWANDCIEDYAKLHRAELIIIHRDIWVNNKALAERLPIAVWFPIDSAPLAELTAEHLKSTRWGATMSKWAVEVARKAGYQLEYIPHSFNPEHYSYRRAPELRAGIIGAANNIKDESFLITVVAANKGFPSRKGFPEMFEAFGRFQKMHPNAYVHIHSLVTQEFGGPDLQKLAAACEMDMSRTSILNPFIFHMGLEPEDMARVYQMSDVLVNTSYGEGFGITILEAQACGTPVITTQFSSMPELTEYGETVSGTLMRTPMMNLWMVPDVNQIVEALEYRYHIRHDPSDRACGESVARAFAETHTDEAVYINHWAPWLARIEREMKAGEAGSIRFD